MSPSNKPPESSTRPAKEDQGAWSLDAHWPDFMAGVADQITEGVSTLQNQFDQLLARGRLARGEHRALSISLDRVKLAGVSTQQVHRFYSGRIRQSHEKVNMAELVEGVLQERKQEFALLGIALRRKLKPVDVLVDPTVAYTLVNAVLDWGLPFGNRIDVRVDLNAWPQQARLQVRVSNEGQPPSSSTTADNLSWILIRQVALAVGSIEIERELTDDGATLTALFGRTVQVGDGISAVDLSDEQSSMFKSLSGAYVLTVSPHLQIRADVRDALREIGILSDSVVDFAQARVAIQARMPSLIVVDAELKDAAFEVFRRELLREVLDFPFVEISPDDSSFDMAGFGELSMAKVGRGNIREALGTAVMFELAKVM